MTRRRLGALGLACLTAALPGPSPAQPGRYGDGAVSPDACAAFGFRTAPDRGDYRPVVGGLAAAAPAYAAPPAPPPPVARSAPNQQVQEMVVTASKRQGAVSDVRAPRRMRPAMPMPVQAQDTERYPNAVANPIRQAASDPVSTFSVDVDTAAYSNVRRFLNDGVRPPSDAVRVEELVNYFDYHYAPPQDRASPFASYVALAPSPWSSERQILHIGIQGFDVSRTEAPPLNLVFLIDTSGSMAPAEPA